MLRITAMVSLIFYISVSIGVHVDVDTCCKSVAGLSLFSESGDHSQTLIEDCCAETGKPSCHPITESTPEGCPSDCIYIQVLQDTPPPVIAGLETAPTAIDIELVSLNLLETPVDEAPLHSNMYEGPPSLAINEELYLSLSAFITYG